MKKLLMFGASGGLGKAITPTLEQHYEVIGVGSKDCNLEEHPWLVEDLLSKYGPDFVVNLAVYNHDSLLSKQDYGNTWRQIQLACTGSANIVGRSMAYFRYTNKPGRIILASSILVSNPVIGAGVYTACKAFIESLARQANLEGEKHGMAATALRLGYCDTGLAHKIQPEHLKKILSGRNIIPTTRVAEEVVDILEHKNNPGHLRVLDNEP